MKIFNLTTAVDLAGRRTELKNDLRKLIEWQYPGMPIHITASRSLSLSFTNGHTWAALKEAMEKLLRDQIVEIEKQLVELGVEIE